ncbi:aminotransferase class I/II-fold pyridoxal phosphate-dependent enzyme [Acinetobacter baumannii]|uniref:aminotransferase class I/II-fold pyridoxal phosphate-dependent enzyme n=1 Tax=Acinetobacter baumannii TaxID=470 RepID=UPI000AEC55BB|nr:aminotransferase class I/II-fold pyridoxal phosphate-dependent enzyme [Acinetobacter baumannii]
MQQSLNQLKQNSIILIQPCCHNPTGMDLSETQQDEIIQIIKKRKIIPFLDMAYHGFAQDIISDRIFVQKLLQQKISFLVANSYSKIFSLYGERIGTLSVVCQKSDIATQVFGQLKSIVRRSYSTPPAQGALLIAEVLNSQYLCTIWLEELKNMQKRMVDMREKLAQGLSQSNLRQDFSYITAQKGMFSYLKITPSEVKKLREVYGVYILESGRICIAGLNKQNLDYVIQSLTDVLSKP